LIAVINLNYMFPIPKNIYNKLQYKDLDKHRTFKNEKEKSKYISLMRTELKVINTMDLDKVALKVYNNKYDKPDSDLAKRCIDFKDMEKLALSYKANDCFS
ncbi:type III toxin-antitoxin system ToxN/AbiQ family toxin, partial [Lachnospiraceae bacterium MD308]|nr:type III toxin-antitoxin system ToxN/AbiQ family toxin [Lachnospiraceae bacterium MD308]